jgi:hypothetical protein
LSTDTDAAPPTIQDRAPNFRDDGHLYLVRCFACSESSRGRENWAMAVATGQCAFCGWTEEKDS